MRPWLSMERGAVGLLGLVLATGCPGDDDAGGGGISAGGTHATTMTTGATTDETPTTSASATMASVTDGSTTGTTTMTETTMVDPPPPLLVECAAPPKGAVGAKYKYKASASGGVPAYKWSAQGLPEGLSINQFTGEITGVPTTPGDYMVTLIVEDDEGSMAMTACPVIPIGDQLGVDYDALEADGPCIVAGGKTIVDYLTGGDGSPVKCAVPGGVGDGKLPSGLAVDPMTCEITGTVTETRYGGWAWIVTAEQNGAKVHAPYCAVQAQQAPKAYKIVGSHSGQVDNELTPILQKVDVGQPLRFDGDADPLFEVTKETCGQSCFFGYMYRVTQSPFGAGDCKSDKDGCFGLCPLVADPNQPDGDTMMQCSLLPKMGTPKIGFAHEMWAKGDVAPQEFTTRPFIIQWSVDYCLSDVQADCQGKDAILANGDDSNLEIPVIFRPQ